MNDYFRAKNKTLKIPHFSKFIFNNLLQALKIKFFVTGVICTYSTNDTVKIS